FIIEDYSKGHSLPFWNFLYGQVTHKVWDGFSSWDLIFPLFMFMAGVSTPLSIDRSLEKGKTKNELLWKIVKRGLILIILGMIEENGLQIQPISHFRFPSVLGKIGASYIFASIIYLYAGKKMQWFWFIGLLIGYWLLLKFTSAPGFPMGDLTEPGNFMSYFDRSVLPGRLSRGIHDTVGLLCTVTGVCTVLMGIFAGTFLKNKKYSQIHKVKWLAFAGVISIILGILWNYDFPFNKNLWSSSFVLLTGGISSLLLALFYYIIDVKGWQRWSFPFRVIGMNSILIYMSPVFIDWAFTSTALFKWLQQLVGEPFGIIVIRIGAIVLQWLFLYFLYKKKIFLKV
ncbi:MAG: acyltransferase family protein, partial [Ginsengibacter sp.]